uniref:Uncharacterized protein n=1 Tax=viral metagenome TaxID=1070528 RepID=A0A6C0DTK7_9ZZZZ
MKNFYLRVFFLLIVILIFSLYTTYKSKKEGYSSNSTTNTIILLGDSILQNSSYVPHDKSIENIISKKLNSSCHCYAKNNAKTYDIYSQVTNIPLELNNRYTTIFLSAGGNDILDKYVERSDPNLNDFDYLNTIFGAYKNLVKTIKTKMENAKLVLLDVYYPKSAKYLPYKNIITTWNHKIYEYAKENNMEVLRVSTILTKPEDFTLEIEPSETGGEKITDAIVGFYLF